MTSLVDSLTRFFEEPRGEVIAAYLFGSRARGTERASSDVDVAVLSASKPPPTYETLPLRLEGELERLLGLPVQIVELRRAPVELVHRVLRDGIILLDRDRPARIRFEVQARAEYLDLVPFLRRYRHRGAGGP